MALAEVDVLDIPFNPKIDNQLCSLVSCKIHPTSTQQSFLMWNTKIRVDIEIHRFAQATLIKQSNLLLFHRKIHVLDIVVKVSVIEMMFLITTVTFLFVGFFFKILFVK